MWCNLKLHHQLRWLTKINSAVDLLPSGLDDRPSEDIWMNTRLRSKSATAFENDVFKLMNNSAFGVWENDEAVNVSRSTSYRSGIVNDFVD